MRVAHDDTVESPAGDPPSRAAGDGAALRPLVEGRYIDFLPVGQGGMGIVYWALDRDLKRQVAFKVIRPPVEKPGHAVTPPVPQALARPGETTADADDFRAMTARFLQEAWITGAMEHPGIVPIYELGCTDAGVPYYTMKFIRDSRTLATALAEVADGDLEARLVLLEPFLKVCDTIRYAHRQGVVHRDLKPENIAIGEFGEVLVLDWGLAKLSGSPHEGDTTWQESVRELRASSGLLTMAGAVGTPGYMAPEAARGEEDLVSERCDVYSLGAILYELLTRRLPIEFRNIGEYIEKLRAEGVPDPQAHEPAVPDSLAAICSSALDPDPERRTQSVDALARALRSWQARRAIERELAILLADADRRLEDVEQMDGDAALQQLDAAALSVKRALDLDPGHGAAAQRQARVEAARGRALRAREQLARSRALKRAGAVALVIAAVSAIVVAGVLEKARQRAETARQDAAEAQERAESDRARAERVMGYMVGEMQESLEPLGRLDLLAGLGREARAYYDDLPEAGRHPDSLRNGALALRKLGDVYNEQGDLPAARSAYEAAVALAEGLPTDDTGESGYLLTQARARLCGVLIAQGYPARAIERLETHLADIRDRAARHPGRDEYRIALAEAYDLICRARIGTFDIDEALTAAQEALSLAEALSLDDDADGTRHRILVRYLLTPARALRVRGRTDEGLARADRAHALASAWRTRKPEDMRWARLEADAAYLRAYFLEVRGDYDEALRLYANARAGYEHLGTLDPGNMAVQHRLTQVHHRTGQTALLHERARTGAATDEITVHHAPFQRAYRMQRALVEKDPSNAYWLHAMIGHCDRMSAIANVRAKGGAEQAQAAEVYREEALGWAKRLMECDPENVVWQHLHVYTLFQRASARLGSEPERAVERLREVIRLCGELVPKHPGGVAELAVLHWWAVKALCDKAPPPRDEQLRMMRASVALLARGEAAQQEDVGVAVVWLESIAVAAKRLGAEAGDEREEAVGLIEAGVARAGELLARKPPLADDVRKNLEVARSRLTALLDGWKEGAPR